MQVSIKVIPHNEQRYDTAGDWWFTKDGDLEIRVSSFGPQEWRKEMLIAHHEYTEALLCKSNGIAEYRVTHFDQLYEANRPPDDESEPGDSPLAPYYEEHQVATGFERILAKELGVDWNEYDGQCKQLSAECFEQARTPQDDRPT